MKIQNPALPGFHADPSIIRVNDTYYIANSTFEWFPGVRLHASKDMIHWKLLPSPLSTTTLLSMEGNPSSGGIWAPDLYNILGWLRIVLVLSLNLVENI